MKINATDGIPQNIKDRINQLVQTRTEVSKVYISGLSGSKDRQYSDPDAIPCILVELCGKPSLYSGNTTLQQDLDIGFPHWDKEIYPQKEEILLKEKGDSQLAYERQKS